MIGFSVPQDGAVLVVSYEGTHLVRLGPPASVETDSTCCEYDSYDPDTGVCHHLDRAWDIIGLHPGRPILTGRDGEHLVLDTEAESLSVVKEGEVAWTSTFANFSGDWAAATFSPDGRFIVLGCPYDFDFRVFERAMETQ
jgi:hypothetical protein